MADEAVRLLFFVNNDFLLIMPSDQTGFCIMWHQIDLSLSNVEVEYVGTNRTLHRRQISLVFGRDRIGYCYRLSLEQPNMLNLQLLPLTTNTDQGVVCQFHIDGVSINHGGVLTRLNSFAV